MVLLLGQSCTDYSDYERVGDYRYKVSEIAELPVELPECSGMTYVGDVLLALNDGGNGATIHELDTGTAALRRSINIENTVNIDWEAMALHEDQLVIGDMGNNTGTRVSQKLYHLDAASYQLINVLDYSLPGQVAEPSISHNFDSEALSVIDDHYYIWTKNRGNDSTYLHVARVGSAEFAKKGSMSVAGLITDSYYHQQSGRHLLLCNELVGESYLSALIVCEVDNKTTDITKLATVPLAIDDKVEAITWLKDDTFLIASESTKAGDLGMLYSMELVGL